MRFPRAAPPKAKPKLPPSNQGTQPKAAPKAALKAAPRPKTAPKHPRQHPCPRQRPRQHSKRPSLLQRPSSSTARVRTECMLEAVNLRRRTLAYWYENQDNVHRAPQRRRCFGGSAKPTFTICSRSAVAPAKTDKSLLLRRRELGPGAKETAPSRTTWQETPRPTRCQSLPPLRAAGLAAYLPASSMQPVRAPMQCSGRSHLQIMVDPMTLSLIFVKSKTAHSASSEVIIQHMWVLRKFGGFARCGHSPSACTSARVFSLLQYAGKTGPSRILCVSEV